MFRPIVGLVSAYIGPDTVVQLNQHRHTEPSTTTVQEQIEISQKTENTHMTVAHPSKHMNNKHAHQNNTLTNIK